jgi:hypothetical protein
MLKTRQVPAYSRADMRVQWTPVRALSLAVSGQNLFGDGHVEFGGSDNAATPTFGSRSLSASLTWRF